VQNILSDFNAKKIILTLRFVIVSKSNVRNYSNRNEKILLTRGRHSGQSQRVQMNGSPSSNSCQRRAFRRFLRFSPVIVRRSSTWNLTFLVRCHIPLSLVLVYLASEVFLQKTLYDCKGDPDLLLSKFRWS